MFVIEREISLLTIDRLHVSDSQTIGALSIEEMPVCWTLEPPWKSNARKFSCIPIGHYKAVRFQSPRFGIETFKILDLEGREVAGRSGIIFHSGNTEADTEGCILPGLEVGKLAGADAVLRSKEAFKILMEKLIGLDEVDLIIT